MSITKQKLSIGHVYLKNSYNQKVELYLEHNTYHVRRFSKFIDGRLIQETWLCFDNLLDAKKAWKRQNQIMRALS